MANPYFAMPNVTYYHGDVLEMLRQLPSQSAHMCVTSPPYWGLRDYGLPPTVWGGDASCEHDWSQQYKGPSQNGGGSKIQRSNKGSHFESVSSKSCSRCDAWSGCLGMEPVEGLYVAHIVEVFREVRRVLRDDATLWLNLGSSFASSGGAHTLSHANPSLSWSAERGGIPHYREDGGRDREKHESSPQPLNLIDIPGDVVRALQADGWYWRSAIIWHKTHPMPESIYGPAWVRCRVKIRSQHPPEDAGLYAYGSGNRRARPHIGNPPAQYRTLWAECPGCPKCDGSGGYILRWGSWRPTRAYDYIYMLSKTDHYYTDPEAVRDPSISRSETNSRNPHDVWLFANSHDGKSRDVHFASYPIELPIRCILAGTGERGVCSNCGTPWVRVLHTEIVESHNGYNQVRRLGIDLPVSRTVGWRPTCLHSGNPAPAVVLDPFLGSGTTAVAAKALGRHCIGIDLSPRYLREAVRRWHRQEQQSLPFKMEVLDASEQATLL